MKDEFISTVSHELRTPLAIMREALSQILEGMHGQVTERQVHFLEVSRLSIDRITRIVENLLDISKIESGRVVLKYEPVNITSLARNVGESMSAACRGKGLGLEYQFAKDHIEAVVDRDRITGVFILSLIHI